MHEHHAPAGPAEHWALSDPAPELAELEAQAAASAPELQRTVRLEGSRAGRAGSRRRGGFAHVFEEWLMPCFGLAALLFSAFMTAPASWFGATSQYRYESGGSFTYENVNFSNVDSRLWLSLIIAVTASVLVLVNVILRSVRGHWTATTQGIGVLFSLFAAGNVVFLTVNIGDGFARLQPALWGHALTLALSALMTVLAFVLYRRGRHYGAGRLFAQLPSGQQQGILADRAAALQVLAQRQVIRDAQVRRLAKRPFGRITASAHAAEEV